MKSCDGEFETETKNDIFTISINQESDVSMDGGYSFENVKNSYPLDRDESLELYKELKQFLMRNEE